jgi:hypothetical protein
MASRTKNNPHHVPEPEPDVAPEVETVPADPPIEKRGGTLYQGGRIIGYTLEGALSATTGGPRDPTILPHPTVDETPQPAPTPAEAPAEAPAAPAKTPPEPTE